MKSASGELSSWEARERGRTQTNTGSTGYRFFPLSNPFLPSTGVQETGMQPFPGRHQRGDRAGGQGRSASPMPASDVRHTGSSKALTPEFDIRGAYMEAKSTIKGANFMNKATTDKLNELFPQEVVTSLRKECSVSSSRKCMLFLRGRRRGTRQMCEASMDSRRITGDSWQTSPQSRYRSRE